MWKLMRALKSRPVDIQKVFIRLLSESEPLSIIMSGSELMLRFFYELRQWTIFKKRPANNILWDLVDPSWAQESSASTETITELQNSIERFMQSAPDELPSSINELHNVMQKAVTISSKDCLTSAVNALIEKLKNHSPLSPSLLLIDGIYDIVVLIAPEIAILVDASHVVVLLQAIYECKDPFYDSEKFKYIIYTITGLLTTPQSQEEFVNRVLLPRMTLNHCILPETLPKFFFDEASDLLVAFIQEIMQMFLSKLKAYDALEPLEFDGRYFYTMLEFLLACGDAPDSLFKALGALFEFLPCDTFTDELIGLLKELFTAKKTVIEFYAERIIREDLLTRDCFDRLVPLLQIIFQNKQTAYQAGYQSLSPALKAKLDAAVGSAILERKQILVYNLALRTVSSADLAKFEKLDISLLSHEQKQCLIPKLHDASIKLLASEVNISWADLVKFVPGDSSNMTENQKNSFHPDSYNYLISDLILALYSKFDLKIPSDILKACCREDLIMGYATLSQLIDLMEIEGFVPNSKFLASCAKKSQDEQLVGRIMLLVPLQGFVEALERENVEFSSALFIHLSQSIWNESFELYSNYLSDSQFQLLYLSKGV